MNVEQLRSECRLRINMAMERAEQKEFADYVMLRQQAFDDALQQAWQDMYQNFKEDIG